jgi:hypothetical protein
MVRRSTPTLERMEQLFWDSMRAKWESLPNEVRYARASTSQVEAFEQAHGPIPSEYRSFLLEFGGGVAGSEWVDGIEQLPNTHRKFRSEAGLGGWTMRDVFVIGWDGAGNPLAIDASGAVVVEDHKFGGVRQVAPSFHAFVAEGLRHAL